MVFASKITRDPFGSVPHKSIAPGISVTALQPTAYRRLLRERTIA